MVTCSVSVAREKRETVTGQVVAYGSNLASCFNGNGYWSMIIHVQKPKGSHFAFLRVDFSLPCEESPKWLATTQPVRTFRLIRLEGVDTVLKESLPLECIADSSSNDQEPCAPTTLPLWKYSDGAENEKLPFGKVIPTYRSADLPLLPIL